MAGLNRTGGPRMDTFLRREALRDAMADSSRGDYATSGPAAPDGGDLEQDGEELKAGAMYCCPKCSYSGSEPEFQSSSGDTQQPQAESGAPVFEEDGE